MRILVIYGGNSSEREVSLRSGSAVAAALKRAGHEVSLYDPYGDESFRGLDNLVEGVDVAFPIIHGKGAEDGAVQTVLERLEVPFVGSSSQVSATCLNKWETLQAARTKGIPAADSQVVTLEALVYCPLARAPFVLKPVMEGSSVDTFLVKDPPKFDSETVKPAFERHGKLLIEELIEGNEITVSVLGEEALPAIEIIPPGEAFFDYENKYNGMTQELCPPQNISEGIQKQAQVLAVQVHKLMGCRDLSRTDFMVGRQGNLYFLEINTLPGMTDQSLYPKAAAAAGLSMDQLVDRLVQMAANRQRNQHS